MNFLLYSHKYKDRTSNEVYLINPKFKSTISQEDIITWVSKKNKELKGRPGEYLQYEDWGLWSCVCFRTNKINKHPYVLGYSANSWESWRRVYKPNVYYKQFVDEMNNWANTFQEHTPHKAVCDEIFDLLNI